MQKKTTLETNTKILFFLILLAYVFSMGIRMYWPLFFSDNLSMFYDGQLMINTNDGYYYMTGARDFLSHTVSKNPQASSPMIFSPGLVLVTAYSAKILGLSIETVSLYLPGVIASLIVVPIVLTGRLMGNTLLGFLAALIGSIAWSYYNRTMVGYYDTDMFSVFLQFSIFYALLHVAYRKDIQGIVLATFLMFVYPYFYPQGMTIVYAVYMLFIVYMFLEYQKMIVSDETDDFQLKALSLYGGIILLSIPLMIALPIGFRLVLFVLAYAWIRFVKPGERYLFYFALGSLIAFLYFSNLFHTIVLQLTGYLSRGVEVQGLHFYQVIQTVREAGAIPFSTMANRISGSQVGVLLSLAGYLMLVIRHKPFIIALPLIGVGILSLWAGLRFTVYAVPVAAISVVYLFFVLGDLFHNKRIQYFFVIMATLAMLYPNIKHILGYKVPTVLNAQEVRDLEQLRAMATDRDYTIAWWDYGYPIWYYSNTSTLIDGGSHGEENFIVSTILQTDSPVLAANMARLEVNENTSIINSLFYDKQKNPKDPNLVLEKLASRTYPLPKKTRDVYLYLPYRMMGIFPTVMVFGNLDLTTGKPKRKSVFFPAAIIRNQGNIFQLSNGIVLDLKKGKVQIGKQSISLREMVIAENTKSKTITIQKKPYHFDGALIAVYMKSYGRIVVMDPKTFQSSYVQMFMLGKYDHNLFELVVASPYSRIYKFKR